MWFCCWWGWLGWESWCWHVFSLLEKSRLRLYFAQTRLLHLMCMGRGHSGWKQILYFSFQVSEFFVSFLSADSSPLFSITTFSTSATHARAHKHTRNADPELCHKLRGKFHKPSKYIICSASGVDCVPYWPAIKPRVWREVVTHLFWLFQPLLPISGQKGA